MLRAELKQLLHSTTVKSYLIAGDHIGATLVCLPQLQLQPAASEPNLMDAIRHFRRQVDHHLPGMYTWFSDDSLHVTLRALV